MNYRKAQISDVNVLVELRKKQLIDEGCFLNINIDNELKEYFLSSIADENIVIWVASENGNIISTCGVCFFQYPPSYSNPTGKVAYITNVYTKDEYRRQGIASMLLNHVMEVIIKREYKIIRLHASLQGKNIYKKMGFVDAEGYMVKKLNI